MNFRIPEQFRIQYFLGPLCAVHSGRAVCSMDPLRRLGLWGHGFESSSKYGRFPSGLSVSVPTECTGLRN
jgi:hypothetical protein